MTNIGATLKEKRQELGKSIEDIAGTTRIRQRYLEAMEKEEWDVFPGRVYLKGFLRTYSRYLGLNDADMVNSLPQLLAGEEQTDPLPERIEIPGRPRRKATIILAVIAILLLFSAQYVYRNYINAPLSLNNQTNVTPTNPAPSSPIVTPPSEEENTDTSVQPEESGEAKPAVIDKMNLSIVSLRGKCWVQIKSGNKLLFEGTLANGKEIAFPDLQTFSFTLGNAGSVAVYINNIDIGTQGGEGDVVRKTFIIENNEVKEIAS